MNHMKKYCDGCLIKNIAGTESCKYEHLNMLGKCPCSNCILKMMCLEGCDERQQFADLMDDMYNLPKRKMKALDF